MKSLTLLIVLAPPLLHAAPIPATPERKKVIMENIAEGLKARKDLRLELIKAKDARSSGDKEAEDAAYMNIDRLKREMTNKLLGAISVTQDSYNIRPPSGPRIVKGGPMKDVRASWDPKFYDPEDHLKTGGLALKTKDKDGRDRYLGGEIDPKELAGGTLDNGYAFITLLAFEKALEDGDPGFLAATLYHESAHFHRLMVEDGWKTDQSDELEAYKAELGHSSVFFPLKVQERWVTDIEDKIAKAKAKLRAGERRPPYVTLEGEKQLKKVFEFERDELEELRRRREEVARAAEDSRQGRYLAAIRGFADRSCSRPGSVTQDELDRLPAVSPSRGSILDRGCRPSGPVPPADLAGPPCESVIFDSLCRPGARPSAAELTNNAEGSLRERWLFLIRDFTDRSCSRPGSVAQEELDALPRISPDALFYMRACAPPLASLGGPSCLEDVFAGLCEAAGSPRFPAASELARQVRRLRSRPVPVAEAEFAPPRAAWQLAGIARKACSAPGSVAAADLAPLYEWFPGLFIADVDKAGGGLSPCAREIYQALLGFSRQWKSGSTINVDWVNHAAGELNRREERERTPPSPDRGQERSRGGGRPYLGPCGNAGSGCRWTNMPR